MARRGARTGSTTTTLERRRRPLSSGALARSSAPVGSAAARCEQLSIVAEEVSLTARCNGAACRRGRTRRDTTRREEERRSVGR
jgi:hypothetical protein